jgi:DNA-binding Lrp family transcriptional regulator
MIKEKEKSISRFIQMDIPVTERPFKVIGERAGIGEEETIAITRDLMQRGIIRKFGAVLRHQKAGFLQNAMVIWAVPPEKCETAGRILSSFDPVTHCYQRDPPFEGTYNIFTMVHFREGEMNTVIQELSSATGIKDFMVLMSEEEYKKSSMEYFPDDR